MPDAPDMRLGEVAEDGFVVTVRSIHSKLGVKLKTGTKTLFVTTGLQDICFKGGTLRLFMAEKENAVAIF